MKRFRRLILFIMITLTIVTVNAHTPLDTREGNSSPETATIIEDPTKSWTIYERLD